MFHFLYRFLRNPTELKNIKNISLLRQQMSPTRVAASPAIGVPAPLSLTIKAEPKIEEDSYSHSWGQSQDDDMPTDLSMPSELHSRKRAHPDSPKQMTLSDKHRISMIVGENLQKLRCEREQQKQHYASLNLKHEESQHWLWAHNPYPQWCQDWLLIRNVQMTNI